MRSYFRPVRELPLTTRYAHGFCCWMSLIINQLKHHIDMFGNYDILLEEEEISKIFDIKKPEYDMNTYTFDIGLEYSKSILNGTHDNVSNAHTICDSILLPKVLQKNIIFNNFFTLKNKELYLEEEKNYLTSKTLGVHIRGTDTDAMQGYNIEDVYRYIKYMIDNYDIDNIFLATDDIRYQNFIVEKFGNLVKFKKDKTISHDGQIFIYVPDRTKLNQEVMIDVYLLSRCRYFLYSFSNVSYLALTMGIKNFDKILCFKENI